MPRLSRPQEESRRRIGDLRNATLPPEELASSFLAALSIAIPADGARLLGVDPATLLVNRTLAATSGDDWARREWLRDAYLASGPLTYVEFPNLMRANLTAVALHERQAECWGYPEPMLASVESRLHQAIFRETGAPLGGTLLASIPADDAWIAALQVYRRDPTRTFSRGDVAFLRLVAPLIGRGLRAALARERALAAPQVVGPDASGIIVLGRNGKVQFSTPAGEAWCDLLRDAGRDGHGPLPTPIWSVLARQRAGEAPATLVVPTPVGQVRIEASTSSTDDALAVVLTPERPPALPTAPDDWSLTPAERQVFAQLLHGESNASIAAQLHISANTVQSHLRHIYEKSGANNRSQLLAHFFRETYSAGMQ
jgi:DNA-binding CsgD family transcriptional regulator